MRMDASTPGQFIQGARYLEIAQGVDYGDSALETEAFVLLNQDDAMATRPGIKVSALAPDPELAHLAKRVSGFENLRLNFDACEFYRN